MREIYPQISETGNPFTEIHIEDDKLPEYSKIVELLKGSNASATILGPKREEDDSRIINDMFEDIEYE